MNYHGATNAELSEMGKYLYWAECWATWQAQVAGAGHNRGWKSEIGILLDRQEKIREVLEQRKRQAAIDLAAQIASASVNQPVRFSSVAEAPQVLT